MNQALVELNNVNSLACELAQEVKRKIKYESYQFQSIELTLLELLACHQQKYQQLFVIGSLHHSDEHSVSLDHQRAIINTLTNIIEQWQQNREVTRLEEALNVLYRELLVKSDSHLYQ